MKIPITYFKGDTSPITVRVKNDGFIDLPWLLNHAGDINDIDYSKVKVIDVIN